MEKKDLWKDPIVEEVRQARQAHAKKFGNDLDAIARDLKRTVRSSACSCHSVIPRLLPLGDAWVETIRSNAMQANAANGRLALKEERVCTALSIRGGGDAVESEAVMQSSHPTTPCLTGTGEDR